MSAEVQKMPSQEDMEGSRIELRTSSGTVICLNFSEKDQTLPRIVRLFDPDTDQALVFRLEDETYRELDAESAANLQEFQHLNHCLHCSCCDGYDESPNGDVRKGDERHEKQKEKLQKKLRERKASNKQEEGNCKGHCHQIIQLPIQGLSKSINDKKEKKLSTSEKDTLSDSRETRGKKMTEDLKIQKAPEVEATTCTTVRISWAGEVTKNNHLSGCTFNLQMFSKSSPFRTIYSGPDKEFTVKDLKPGTQYKFRLLAENGEYKGEYSPEATCDMPCSVPATPTEPHIAKEAKTSFTLKWTAPEDNGASITSYKLEWNKGKKGGPFEEIYCGPQRQYKLSHKLPPATPCSFRIQAFNSIGASKFSKELKCFSSAGAPSTPTAPSLDRAGVNFLDLQWNEPETNGAEILEYKLEMEDERTGYGFLVQYCGPEQSCRIEKLDRNTRYKFRLQASNSAGSSKWSNTVMFDTIPEKPGKPSSPVLQGKVRTSAFTVSWDPPSDTGGAEISSYVLEMDDGKVGSFTEVYRGLECEYSFSGLSPGHLYRVRLASISEGGISEWSKVARIRTLAVAPGQANPPCLSKTHKSQPDSLDLYWDPPNYNGGAVISGYILEMEKPSTKEFVEIHHLVDNECTVAGLLPGRTYSFRVRAKNEAGVGKVSPVSHISTAPGAPDVPRPPDTMCRSAAAITVSWECPAENGTPVTGYTLEWMEDGTFTELYSGPDRTCEVRKGISPASYYYFRVKALSAAGSSLWSPVSTCQTPAASPSAVTSVKVIQQSSSHVRLRWKHPNNNGAAITSYNVEVAGCKNISFDVVTGEGSGNEDDTSVTQEYDITELHPNTLYRIRVQAVNKIGCGPFSSTVFASTGDLPPPAPTLELGSASYQSLKLRWMSRGSGVSYTLQMMDKNGGFSTVFNGPSTSHKVGKLQERTEYQFRIQASNEAGPGPFSELVSFKTTAQPPNMVKGLKAENISSSSLAVSWEAVAAVRKGESIEYILQSQCAGKDQDFVQVYKGPGTSFQLDSLPAASEFRFRVCAVRLMNAPSESPGPLLKGVFSSETSSRTMSPRKKKISESGSVGNSRQPEEAKPSNLTLTDTQWAIVFFVMFFLLTVGVAFLLASLFGVSD